MNAIRKIYDDMPDSISIPQELTHKRVEVILFALDPIPRDDATTDILSIAGGAERAFANVDVVNAQKTLRNEW